jgi:hypothetical protein
LQARRRRTRVRTNGELPRLMFCHVGVESPPWRDRIGTNCCPDARWWTGCTIVRTH